MPLNYTEKTVQAQLLWYCLTEMHHRLAVPNTRGLFNYEADATTMTDADLIHEWEIKLSRSDFIADFKKSKHHWLEWWKSDPKEAKAVADIRQQPNYFWYVVPGTIADTVLDLVPDYAGLLVMTDRINYHHSVFKLHKPAPLLHNNKVDERTLRYIMRSMSFHLASQLAVTHPIRKPK